MTNRLLMWAVFEIAVGVSFAPKLATAQADAPDSSWKAITEGLSRDELFKQFADDTTKEQTGGGKLLRYHMSLTSLIPPNKTLMVHRE